MASINIVTEVKMKRGVAFSVAGVLFLLVLAVASSARADEWVLLGERTVALVSEQDHISVTSEMGMFRAIRIDVRDRGVDFENVQIQFGDGQVMDVPVRSFIPAGGSTRVIDLPNAPRYVNNITFYYKTRPGTLDRAVVSVWGLRD
jgi:hypothetical protein